MNDKVSKLQKESLSFSKFKKSSNDLDDMLSQQKLSQDKEGLGFSRIEKTTSVSLSKPIMFVKEGQNEKTIVPQTPFANTRGTQTPITRSETPKQFHNPVSRNGLGYKQDQVDHKPILPTPNTKPSYSRRNSYHNNRSSSRRNFYKNKTPSHHEYNSYQRRENSYPNQRFFRPHNHQNFGPRFQNQSNSFNNSWSMFSNYGLETLSVLLQDPRMFNLEMFCANNNGPNNHWGPSF